MNNGYLIFMFFFVFGSACGFFNATGLWSHQLPNPNYNISDTQLSDINSNVQSTQFDFFTMWYLIMSFLKVIGYGLLAVVSVALVLNGVGLTTGLFGGIIIQVIQAPLQFVMLFFLYEQATGRTVE
jgi:hypothetical protein